MEINLSRRNKETQGHSSDQMAAERVKYGKAVKNELFDKKNDCSSRSRSALVAFWASSLCIKTCSTRKD